jgi:hypothetical protein
MAGLKNGNWIEKWKLVGFQNCEKLVGKLVKSVDKPFVTVLYF